MAFPSLDKEIDLQAIEERIRGLWEREGIYHYDNDAYKGKPVFSVDTPPPYVSAAHLHVGHAMSYTQAEFVIRYKRMKGYRIFYPMGFDDNGLPTERYVEQTYKIDKKKTTRSEFRALCEKETAIGAKEYEKLWRALGLSVDWSLRYSTIDKRSRHTAQKSFIDLYNKNLIYRANEPVLWDTHFESSLAQADLDTLSRKGKMYDISFMSPEGNPLVISTTRPELIPACVGLFVHPEDERYASIISKKAKVPLFDYEVPILTSEDVDKDFGTGLMMVCTFGDGEDVKKWKLNKLDTRIVIDHSGKMNELAGEFKGLTLPEARKRIVEALSEKGLLLGDQIVEQNVSVGERSGVPVEFVMTPQWFIDVLNQKDRLRKRAEDLTWFPEFMKIRLEQWIDGLKYDWNISRQRFYGVPFPVWYVKETGDIIIADEDSLPVDPIEDSPPAWALEKYKNMTIIPETDVMDTWMTSSLTPLINANWAGEPNIKGDMETIYPMSLRVQAFEIIRTWLFYTMLKSDYHTQSLPWEEVMISGWGLNEQGKKISKRDLEKFTDANGFNRYNPYSMIEKYGADALRYWASNSQLGQDLRFHERDVKDGRKIVVKLWNVARMCFMYMDDFDPQTQNVAFEERTVEDQWILSELNKVIAKMSESFEICDYATAKESLNKFFWMNFCDDYLELVKARFWELSEHSEQDKNSACCTLYECLRTLLGLFAPYLPYITEEIYQVAGKFGENCTSIHVSDWPKAIEGVNFKKEQDIKTLLSVLYFVRKFRSERKLGAVTLLENVTIDFSGAKPELQSSLKAMSASLKGAARTSNLTFGIAEGETDIEGVKISISAFPEGEAPKMVVAA